MLNPFFSLLKEGIKEGIKIWESETKKGIMLNAICHNCFEYIFPGYWHFENGVTKVMDYLMSLQNKMKHFGLTLSILKVLTEPKLYF